MRRFLLVLLALVLVACSAQAQQVRTAALQFVVNSQTCADNGNGGTASSVTLTVAEISYIALTQNDAQGCTVTVSETGAHDGQWLTIVNISANTATFADTAGVTELQGSFAAGQYDTLTLIYRSNTWVEVTRSAATAGDVTASSTTTFTNKTMDAEGTGNTITIVEKRDYPVDICVTAGAYESGGFSWVTGGGVDAYTNGCAIGSNTLYGRIEFTDSATGYIHNKLWLPSDWTGTIDVKLLWTTTATSGNAKWQIQTSCSASGEVLDNSWNTADTVTTAANASASRMIVSTLTGISTTGCSASELMFFRILRNPADAADTLGASAFLVHVEVTYRRAQ